jgi:hypothetical protein
MGLQTWETSSWVEDVVTHDDKMDRVPSMHFPAPAGSYVRAGDRRQLLLQSGDN